MLRYHSLLLLLAPFRSSSAFPNPAHYLFDAHLAAGTNETQNLLVRAGEPGPLTTCGYLDGNPTKFRTADSGYNCRFDTANSLWGYCPTTVIQAVDCGLAGACIDQYDCTKGCGDRQGKLTTFTCTSDQYCSTALLTFANDQSYSYIACGGKAGVDSYFVSPTAAATTTKTTTTTTNQDTKATQPTPLPTATPEPKQTSTTPFTTSSSTSGNTGSSNGGSNGGSATSAGPTSSAMPPATSTTATPPGSGTNNIPAIIGGVIGGIALLCIFGLAAIYLIRRDKKATAKRNREKRSTELSGLPNADEKKYPSHRDTGGWGPRELPAHRSDPVELPS